MSLLQAVHLQMTSKTATIQCKPVTSLASNNNALVQYKLSCGFDQISHALSNIHGLYGCSCNLFDLISVYSLKPGKLPGHFSYKRPRYEARNTPEVHESCHCCCRAGYRFVHAGYLAAIPCSVNISRDFRP